MTNFEEIGDEGEIWFGIESVEKMVEWTEENIPVSTSPPPHIMEIGSGNGTLLFALVEAGYKAENIRGIDYSEDAVNLSKAIALTRNAELVKFERYDFLTEAEPLILGGWDLLLDKGTYDAIALGEKDEQGRSPAASYPMRASNLLKQGGYFLITCTSGGDHSEFS